MASLCVCAHPAASVSFAHAAPRAEPSFPYRLVPAALVFCEPMPPKKHRLSRRLFDELHRTGTRVRGPTLTLLYTHAPQAGYAVVVSKKTARKAHMRRLVRRRVYHALMECAPALEASRHIAVFVSPAGATLPYHALRDELGELIKRISGAHTHPRSRRGAE